MLFKNHKSDTDHIDLILNNKSISKVQSTKFLGVEIDEKLTWKNHISDVERKISSAIFLLRNIKYKINQKTSLMLYDSLINTQLSYCNMIWANTFKTYTENLIRLQKRALRLCYHGQPFPKTTNLFCKTNRLPVSDIAKLQLAKIVYLFYNSPDELPYHIKLLFAKTSDIHTYSTRAMDNMQLHTHYFKTNIRKNTTKILAPTL